MSTEERGGGGDGGEGFISRQFSPPRLPRAEDEQGGLDPPLAAVSPPAAVGSESPPPVVYGSPAAAGSPPGVTRGSPPAPEDEHGGLDPPAAASGGSPAAETSLVSSGVAEPEVQQGPPRNLASRCCNFRFDNKKLWVCAAVVLLVLPLLPGIIYLLLSH